jgi:ribosomal-protein-alanine N-acetyltransferase
VTPLVDGDIRLEPLTADHGEAMDALAREEGVARFTRIPVPVPDGFGHAWVDRYVRGRDENTQVGFAILDSGTGDVLGFIALVKLELEIQEAEAGYIVASRARGRGIATRALRLLTAWAFDEFPLERIELLMSAENHASEVVAERCGYTREGVLRWIHFKGDIREDTVVYSMLRREHAA